MTEEYGHISDAFDNLPEEELLMPEDIDTSWLKPIEDKTKQLKKETEQIRQQIKDIQQPNGDFLKNYPDVTRVEVITGEGREFVRYECSNVQVSLQDDGQTLKVFLS
jgi:hypothetical protein